MSLGALRCHLSKEIMILGNVPRYDPRCVELMGHIIIKKINKLKKIETNDFYYLKISSLIIKKKIY